ncbi:MAG: hypothetical protein AAGF49_07545, partial [Pseudomonadota bacterium]
MLTERTSDDPFVDLSAAACNLMGECLGVRYCGAIASDVAELRAASLEFNRLPQALQRRAVDEIVSTVATRTHRVDEEAIQPVVPVPVPKELGSGGLALLYPDADTIIFAVPQEAE